MSLNTSLWSSSPLLFVVQWVCVVFLGFLAFFGKTDDLIFSKLGAAYAPAMIAALAGCCQFAVQLLAKKSYRDFLARLRKQLDEIKIPSKVEATEEVADNFKCRQTGILKKRKNINKTQKLSITLTKKTDNNPDINDDPVIKVMFNENDQLKVVYNVSEVVHAACRSHVNSKTFPQLRNADLSLWETRYPLVLVCLFKFLTMWNLFVGNGLVLNAFSSESITGSSSAFDFSQQFNMAALLKYLVKHGWDCMWAGYLVLDCLQTLFPFKKKSVIVERLLRGARASSEGDTKKKLLPGGTKKEDTTYTYGVSDAIWYDVHYPLAQIAFGCFIASTFFFFVLEFGTLLTGSAPSTKGLHLVVLLIGAVVTTDGLRLALGLCSELAADGEVTALWVSGDIDWCEREWYLISRQRMIVYMLMGLSVSIRVCNGDGGYYGESGVIVP